VHPMKQFSQLVNEFETIKRNAVELLGIPTAHPNLTLRLVRDLAEAMADVTTKMAEQDAAIANLQAAMLRTRLGDDNAQEKSST
jgi:hypothetical protein